MSSEEKRDAVPVEPLIQLVRGQKVLLDSDLARIYGVPTKALNQAVKRNKDRFPPDFAFQLTTQESSNLRSQFATLKPLGLNRSQIVTGSQKYRDPRFRPYVFTEHGAIMAANLLKSRQAVRMSVFVVRAFVRLREALSLHKDLSRKLEVLEKRVGVQDDKIQAVFDAIRELMKAPEKPKRGIGFRAEEKLAIYRVN